MNQKKARCRNPVAGFCSLPHVGCREIVNEVLGLCTLQCKTILAGLQTVCYANHDDGRGRRPKSRRIAPAAFRPGRPVTPPPGWVPEPHR